MMIKSQFCSKGEFKTTFHKSYSSNQYICGTWDGTNIRQVIMLHMQFDLFEFSLIIESIHYMYVDITIFYNLINQDDE